MAREEEPALFAEAPACPADRALHVLGLRADAGLARSALPGPESVADDADRAAGGVRETLADEAVLQLRPELKHHIESCNFQRLDLGCIDADFCNQIVIL